MPQNNDRPDMFEVALKAMELSGRDLDMINPAKVRNVVYTIVRSKCEQILEVEHLQRCGRYGRYLREARLRGAYVVGLPDISWLEGEGHARGARTVSPR